MTFSLSFDDQKDWKKAITKPITKCKKCSAIFHYQAIVLNVN